MNTLNLNYQFAPTQPSRRIPGMLAVLVLHAVVGYALFSGTAARGIKLTKKALEAVVIQEVLLPPPPPVVKEIRPVNPLAPPNPRTEPQPAPVASAVPASPPQAEVAAPLSSAPPSTHAVALPAPPAADTEKARAVSLETEYASLVRAMLNSTKRYPTGRAASQQRPQGKVKVWFLLARNGALLECGVLQSANSNLLDDAALAAVRRGAYPPFPTATWDGEDQHKFSAEIEFSPPSS